MILLVFQATIGSNFFTYVAEIGTSPAMGLANFTLFTFILIISIITPIFFDDLGNPITFSIFAGFNLIGLVSNALILKDTSGLSKAELSQLYVSKSYIDTQDDLKKK